MTPERKKIQNLDLAAFCPHTILRVPAIIVHCVNEIERRGLNSVGLYRICQWVSSVCVYCCCSCAYNNTVMVKVVCVNNYYASLMTPSKSKVVCVSSEDISRIIEFIVKF